MVFPMCAPPDPCPPRYGCRAPSSAWCISSLPVAERPAPWRFRVRHLHCQVVVIGMGESGQAAAAEATAAGKDVIAFDARWARSDRHLSRTAGCCPHRCWHVADPSERRDCGCHRCCRNSAGGAGQSSARDCHDVRAAQNLAAAGIDLGRVVAIGATPQGVNATLVAGELVRGRRAQGRSSRCQRGGCGRAHCL